MSANPNFACRHSGQALITETLLLALAACAPLQQAPLVYSSAVQVGVRVGVNPTQPDTAEISVGVKVLDAAYAPVAVARPEFKHYLDSDKNGRISDDLFRIHEIYGRYGTQKAAADADRNLSPSQRKDLEAYFSRLDELKAQDLALKQSNREWIEADYRLQRAQTLQKQLMAIKAEACLSANPLDEGQRLQALLDAAQSCLTGDGDNKYPDLNKAVEAIAEIPPSSTITQLKVEREQKLKIVNQKKAEKSNKEMEVREVEAKIRDVLERLAGTEKRDAISVYGTFNSDTGAAAASPIPTVTDLARPSGQTERQKSGVSLSIGKVFSTGIAAQNLSEAQKVLASATPLSACVQSLPVIVEKMAEKSTVSERNEFVKTYLSSCGEMAAKVFDDKKGK